MGAMGRRSRKSKKSVQKDHAEEEQELALAEVDPTTLGVEEMAAYRRFQYLGPKLSIPTEAELKRNLNSVLDIPDKTPSDFLRF